MTDSLVDIENLQTYFYTDAGVVRAVDDVSLRIRRGKTLGLVGESGSGKSVTAMSIIRLVSSPADCRRKNSFACAQAPTVNRPLRSNSRRCPKSRCAIARQRIAMIFQEPMTSLNPVLHDRRADRRGDPPASRRQPAEARERRDRNARAGRHPERRSGGSTNIRINLRRHASAGHDRDGAGLQSGAADCRRADDGAGRHDSGADSGTDARAAGKRSAWRSC